jgi:hypothetical protein
MYQLYSVLKDREDPPTPEEIDITSGKKQLDGHAEVEYLKKLEKSSENIKKAFEDQQVRARVSDYLLSMCVSHLVINRANGTSRSLNNILWNGSSHAINLSMRLKNLSLSHTPQWQPFENSATQHNKAACDENG